MPAERSTGKASGRVSSAAKSSKVASASTSGSKKGAKGGALDSSAKAASGPPLQENSEIWADAAREAKRARGGKAMSPSKPALRHVLMLQSMARV